MLTTPRGIQTCGMSQHKRGMSNFISFFTLQVYILYEPVCSIYQMPFKHKQGIPSFILAYNVFVPQIKRKHHKK